MSLMKKVVSVLATVMIMVSGVPALQGVASASELDTTSKIQAQIDKVASSGGGTVTLPAKKILVNTPITVKSNVHLKGAGKGKTILAVDPSKKGLQKIINADRQNNVEISNLTVDGEKDLRPHLVNSGNYHLIDFAWSEGFKIHDVEILDAVDAGIVLYNSANGEIYNNTLKNGGSNAILGMEKTHDINIKNNYIDKTDNQNGIFMMYQSASTYNINIIGNTVNNVADYAIEVGHTTHKVGDAPHRNIVIKDNVINNAYCTGIGLRTVSDATVEGNTIKGYGQAKGYGCNAVFVEGRVEQQKNVDVKNNQIIQLEKNVKKTDSDATPYQQAMYITGMRDMDITGNTITVENPKNAKNKNWSDGIKVIASWGAEGYPSGRREFKDIRVNNNTITNVESNGISFESAGSTGNTANYNTISKFGGKAIAVEKNVAVQQVGNKIGDEVVIPPTPEPIPEPTPEPVVPTPEPTPVVPTPEPEPVVPTDPTNIWTNPTTISPLANGYPKAQRLSIKPAKYVVTFDAKSTSGKSTLNLYFDKRESLNQNLVLGTSYKSYKFEFTTKVEQEMFFFTVNNAKDISIKDVKLVKASAPTPEPIPVPEKTFSEKLEILVTKVKQLHEKDKSGAESLVDEFIKMVDERLKK